ncbi:MAG: ATP-binding protein [Deltaproteobacteria bacterium]|nr:ATP-binding protein [Deltaproteobacteria bacterium]
MTKEPLSLEDYKAFFEMLGKDVISSATNVKGEIIYANDKFVEVSKYRREELLGKTHRIIKSEFHPPEFYAEMWRTIAAGKVWRGEVKNKAKDGTYYWVDTSIAPILGANGKPEKYVSVRFLITDRKYLDQLKDHIITTISHELRTPLAIMTGAVSNLKDGIVEPLGKNQMKLVKMAGRAVDQLKFIVNNITDLSNLESGFTQPNCQPVNMGYLISEQLENIRVATGQGHIALKVDCPKDIPSVSVDPELFAKLLKNLLSNALCFAKKQVMVRVKVEQRGGENFVHCSVWDDGAGIAKADKEHLFEKFVQANPSKGGAGYKGLGIGLCLCKQIVCLHQGNIWAESDASRGTTFHVQIPI